MNPDTYRFYKNLTWDDLVDWFEDRIVDRGQKYQKQGRVSGSRFFRFESL